MLWNGGWTRPKPDQEIVVADGNKRPSLKKTNGALLGKRLLQRSRRGADWFRLRSFAALSTPELV